MMKEDEKLQTKLCIFMIIPMLIAATSTGSDVYGILYIQYFVISFIIFYLNTLIIKNVNKWYSCAIALCIFNYFSTFILEDFENIAYAATGVSFVIYLLSLLISEIFSPKHKQFNIFKWHFQNIYFNIQSFFSK